MAATGGGAATDDRALAVPARLRLPPLEDGTVDVPAAAASPIDDVLIALSTTNDGLTTAEARQRLAEVGRNSLRTHHARPWPVLVRQVRSPLLVLLALTALASFFLGEGSDAVIIAVILSLSVGLGFFNEYRAEKATEALHSQIRHTSVVLRDGSPTTLDVTELVPGDVVVLRLGEVVPADLRLMSVTGLECDESVLTGESLATEKGVDPLPAETALGDLANCAFMGTVVTAGAGRGVVVATGVRTQFGAIAKGLGEQQPETEFQAGLRKFSMLLVQVAGVLTTGVLVINLALGRPVIDALLFSLAIAVGITPQLLPAVVSTSLAAGSRQLAHRKVLVKRLVCIEDLGDIEVLFTDKTGTLTEGRISYMRSIGPDGAPAEDPCVLGLVATEVTAGQGRALAGNALDDALWTSPASQRAQRRADGYTRLATAPFDHERRLVSVLATDSSGAQVVVTKGAPETVLARSYDVPASATRALEQEFAAGHRVVAVATRPADGQTTLSPEDEHHLTLRGFLVFLDPPKSSAKPALRRLGDLGVDVKVVTGDNAAVAKTVCADLGINVSGVLTGGDVEQMDDVTLAEHLATTTVFARVSPDHKARIVKAQRQHGTGVAFLGDGVNDALALHAADVGISVDTATDVAKDAADVILLEKDLDVVADGVEGGRRIFANTMKYVLMGTSSNFGNMFSAAGASAFLKFLPMLPSQILLNNLLYDASQLAIPTDHVDPELVQRPTRWDIGFIRRFMLVFGPVSSLFDFATFGILIWGFDAHAALFRSGWFVESLATQTLVIFVIRTRRSPFLRSTPSVPLLLSALSVVLIGALIPATPLAHVLGFAHMSAGLYLTILALVVFYLALVEAVKRVFMRRMSWATPPRTGVRRRRVVRRAARFTHHHEPPAARTTVRRRSARRRSPSRGIAA